MAPKPPVPDDDEDFLDDYQPPSVDEMRAMLGDVQHDVDVMAAELAEVEEDDDLDDDDEYDEELRRERDLGYSAHGADGDGEWTEGYDY